MSAVLHQVAPENDPRASAAPAPPG
jgi:hypothetical protein